MKQLVILAGGKGTRLQERLGKLPKPLVDIGGKPLLEHQIQLANAYGFKDIILSVCYQAQAIREFCGDGSRWSVKISYIEEINPLGTAGAILSHLDHFQDTFMVMYGDTMLNVDLSRFWDFHQQQKAEVSLFLHPNDHPHDSDLVEIDSQDRIINFHPYPHAKDKYYANLVNAALYVMQKNSLVRWKKMLEIGTLDFVKHLFPRMLMEKLFFMGYHSTEYIKDVGNPERLDQVRADLQSGKIHRCALNIPKPAIFIDRDGTLTQELSYVTSPTQLHLINGVAQGIKRINQSGNFAFLTTNQPVIARGMCTEVELKQIHNKLETLLGQEGAYLDAIYYCPHHPDQGFVGECANFKIRCACRKPNIGLLEQAQQRVAIDLKNSWFIGDSTVDLQTAKNAGIKSILVRTGLSGCDDKYAIRPDFECYDFSEAVKFILDKFPMLYAKAKQQTTNIQAGERIVIGGLARSGKSTWATLVKLALAERGIDAVIISLDGWIKGLDQRKKNSNVLERHDINGLRELFKKIEIQDENIMLHIPRYNRLLRKPSNNHEIINLSSRHVIIFEGVVAFLIEELVKNFSHLFYLNRPEEQRLENFCKEYRLRGFTESEISRLHQEREADENSLIRTSFTAQMATIIEA